MATQWGSHTLGSGESAGWYFVRPVTPGFLPIISVLPLTPSFTNPGQFWQYYFPFVNQLGIGTIWSQLTDDGTQLKYYLFVMNRSNYPIEYAFVEADL